jgi:hypothetical protein
MDNDRGMRSYLLLHEHPAKRIAESVGFVMDLIRRSGQVRLRARHLASHPYMSSLTCGVMGAVLTIRIFGGGSDMLTRTRRGENEIM